MKKILMMSVILLAGMMILPLKTQAQYTGWNTPINNYIRYKMVSKAIRDSRKRSARRTTAKRKKVVRKKRIVRRKSRRISVRGNLIEPKLGFQLMVPKKIYIV